MANSIKFFRVKAGLMQVQLAERIGISPVTLSRYETGSRTPRWSNVEVMCRELKCSADELMGEDPTVPRAVATARRRIVPASRELGTAGA